jgi:hypothetical protein
MTGCLVCGAEVPVPQVLVAHAVVSYVGWAEAGEEWRLRCTLEAAVEHEHHDLLWDGPADLAVWTRWTDARPPVGAFVLPDCPVSNGLPGGAADACVFYAAHPGRHSWDLFDPVLEHARTVLLPAWRRQFFTTVPD